MWFLALGGQCSPIHHSKHCAGVTIWTVLKTKKVTQQNAAKNAGMREIPPWATSVIFQCYYK